MNNTKNVLFSQTGGNTLSMKMRVESIQGIEEINNIHKNNNISPNKNKKLPLLTKPLTKFITGVQFDAPKTESLYERLSGTYQFESNMGVLQDRHPIVHPTALCVRCSEPSAMCMSCTEILCNNSVTFFRRSRAKGAAQLFANAIKEAGMTKATKLMLFKLWKNGYELRKRQDLKMKQVVERMFGNSCLYTPFKAWQKYTKDNLVARKDKKMQEMAARIAQLEYQVKDVTKQKDTALAKVLLLLFICIYNINNNKYYYYFYYYLYEYE